jgi:hypothetical protein
MLDSEKGDSGDMQGVLEDMRRLRASKDRAEAELRSKEMRYEELLASLEQLKKERAADSTQSRAIAEDEIGRLRAALGASQEQVETMAQVQAAMLSEMAGLKQVAAQRLQRLQERQSGAGGASYTHGSENLDSLDIPGSLAAGGGAFASLDTGEVTDGAATGEEGLWSSGDVRAPRRPARRNKTAVPNAAVAGSKAGATGEAGVGRVGGWGGGAVSGVSVASSSDLGSAVSSQVLLGLGCVEKCRFTARRFTIAPFRFTVL